MPSELLTFLKYLFLAVLYLFFLRVLRAVWIELREPKPVAGPTAGGIFPPAPRPESPGPESAPPDSKGGIEQLVVRQPAERQGQSFDLGEELTVGRAAECGVTLPEDSFVSQLHTRVFRRGGNLYVEDLGSTNGTYVNGKLISAPVALRRGDHLQVGKTVLETR